MKRPEKGRALFYSRDSGGKHEMTPAQYVNWAIGKTVELRLRFSGTGEAIETMIRSGQSHHGDLFLDYDVSGNLLSRDGLDQLIAEVKRDLTVSHILIPRRDRLARPDNALDAIQLENSLRCEGITLVYTDRVCPPVVKGQRQDVADLIAGVIDFDRAGKDRRDLAQKILFAQIGLATNGFSIGGRPPYGFRRWLVKKDGMRMRQLDDGERVRMAGHSVVWLPVADDHPERQVIRRILIMLETTPASRVDAMLTAEGVPTPNAGRSRRDRGVLHTTSGVWHQPTITNIARNPLLIAINEYGRRSMGDQLRFTSSGPRNLSDADFRADGKPKVTNNSANCRIQSPAPFAPIVDREQHGKLQAILDARAGTQRGKPRSHDPSKNPLGGSVFDMACGWPMYRTPYVKTFRYVCGFYTQSHGQECNHNHVEGPVAARFALSFLRQKILRPGLQAELRERLRQLADQERVVDHAEVELKAKRATLQTLAVQLDKVQKNMALADTPEQFRAVSTVFEDLAKQKAVAESEVQAIEAREPRSANTDAEIDAAMAVLDWLPELAADGANLVDVGDAARLVNFRLFLGFKPVQVKKRTLNKVARGVVTVGDDPPPVALYTGPTGRRAMKSNVAAMVAAGPGEARPALPDRLGNGREGESLGNVNRGEWTPIEPFFQAVIALEPHVQRLILAA